MIKMKTFCIKGIANGFSIDDEEFPTVCTYHRYYTSTIGADKCKVEARINKEIVGGNYFRTDIKPLVINALVRFPLNLL